MLKDDGELTKQGKITEPRSRREKPREISLTSGVVLPEPSAISGRWLGEPLPTSRRMGTKTRVQGSLGKPYRWGPPKVTL